MAGWIFADAVGGAPEFTGDALRLLLGVLGAAGTDRPLAGLPGLSPATPDTFITATGSTWTVQSHGGRLDLETSLTAAAYPYVFDADVTGSVTAADATYDRIDLLSVRLDDPSQGDGSSVPVPVIVYTSGTAAASPTAPATPARSMALAQVRVPVSGGGSPVVTVVAPYTAAAGGIVQARSIASLPAFPVHQQFAAVGDNLLRYDSNQWRAGASTPRAKVVRDSNFAVVSAGSGTLMGSWSTGAPGYSWGLTSGQAGITTPFFGFARISCNATFSQNATNDRGVLLTINGAEPAHMERANVHAATLSRTSVCLSTTRQVAIGDLISVIFYQNSGGTLNVEFASLEVELIG